MAMETSALAVTVIDDVDVKLPEVAVMVAVPAFTPVTRPPVDTVAMVLSELVQETELVMSEVLLSSKVPEAVSCCVPLTAMVAEVGATAIDVSLALTKKPHPTRVLSRVNAMMPRAIIPVLARCRAL